MIAATESCSVCGAARTPLERHRHEDPNWKPRYDDFEGTLEGYEYVPVPAPAPAQSVQPD